MLFPKLAVSNACVISLYMLDMMTFLKRVSCKGDIIYFIILSAYKNALNLPKSDMDSYRILLKTVHQSYLIMLKEMNLGTF